MNAIVEAPVSFTPKYRVGDVVFFVWTDRTGGEHPCPDCLGSKVWPIVSPAGVPMEMDCPRCTLRGHGNDQLNLYYTKHVYSVRRLTIGSVQIDTADRRDPIRYMCVETGVGSGSVYQERSLYSTEEAARTEHDAKVRVLQAEEDATPTAMAKAERSRMGYFNAMRASLTDKAFEEAKHRYRSEIEDSEYYAEGEFTKGPWKAEGGDRDSHFGFDISAPNLSESYFTTLSICSGYGQLSSGFPSDAAARANARLIAAAPTMYQALRAAQERDADAEQLVAEAIALAVKPA